MDLFATWLPPAAIIAVILFANNQTNKRISDLREDMRDKINGLRNEMNGLRNEMKNDHANVLRQLDLVDKRLSEKIDSVDKRLSEKINSVQSGLESLRQDFKLLRQDFIRHLESHIDSDKKEK